MSTPRTWYLGPLGDLRPLVCPDKGITMTEERYGGIHQGISGARTLDVTGHRATYELALNNLTQEEFAWIEALHLRHIPGPFRLLNPLKKNRLTGLSSRMVDTGGRSGLWRSTGVSISYTRDWPDEVSIPGVTAIMPGTAGQDICGWDAGKPAPRLPGEDINVSVYLKSTAGMDIRLKYQQYDSANTPIGYFYGDRTVTTEWTRHDLFVLDSALDPACVSGMFFIDAVTTGALYVAAPMLEAANTPSPWEMGGAAPEVVIDQMPVTSPIFPLRSANLTLLET